MVSGAPSSCQLDHDAFGVMFHACYLKRLILGGQSANGTCGLPYAPRSCVRHRHLRLLDRTLYPCSTNLRSVSLRPLPGVRPGPAPKSGAAPAAATVSINSTAGPVVRKWNSETLTRPTQ